MSDNYDEQSWTKYAKNTLIGATIGLMSLGAADTAIAQEKSDKDKFFDALDESPVAVSNMVIDHRTFLDEDNVPDLWAIVLNRGEPLKDTEGTIEEEQYALVYKDENGAYQFDRPSLHYEAREATRNGYDEFLAGDLDGDGDQDLTAKQSVGPLRLIAFYENTGSGYDKTTWTLDKTDDLEEYVEKNDTYINNDAMEDVRDIPLPDVPSK